MPLPLDGRIFLCYSSAEVEVGIFSLSRAGCRASKRNICETPNCIVFFESPEVQRIVLSFYEATTCRKITVRNTSAAPRRKHRFVINCVELK